MKDEQLTLGELIEVIEKLELFYDEEKGEYKSISFDFGTAIPTYPHSWRGSYNELAIGYQMTGYDSDKNHGADIKVDEFLKILKETIGKVFEGWKGGEFRMGESTPVWVSNQGNASNTIIVGVFDWGWCLKIQTIYSDY